VCVWVTDNYMSQLTQLADRRLTPWLSSSDEASFCG